jgi:quinolinate synthase
LKLLEKGIKIRSIIKIIKDKVGDEMNQIEKLKELKEKKNAIILAHYYQNADIQDIADYVGDSYYLSEVGRDSDAKIIVYCGVKFMAESAKILSPEKTVLFPAVGDATCCMEEQATPELILKMKAEHPNAKVVTYINSSSEVKAVSDACCTSSSALKIVENIDTDKIIFAPDQNLASYVAEQTNKKIIPFNGQCDVHHEMTLKNINELTDKYGKLEILAHPECRKEIRDVASYVGSTAGILNYAKNSPNKEMIVVTETGIIHQLKKDSPEKEFYFPDMVCSPMKKISIESIIESLETGKGEVIMDKELIEKAKISLLNMHKYAGG